MNQDAGVILADHMLAAQAGPARSQDLLDAVAHLDELDDVAQIARLTAPP